MNTPPRLKRRKPNDIDTPNDNRTPNDNGTSKTPSTLDTVIVSENGNYNPGQTELLEKHEQKRVRDAASAKYAKHVVKDILFDGYGNKVYVPNGRSPLFHLELATKSEILSWKNGLINLYNMNGEHFTTDNLFNAITSEQSNLASQSTNNSENTSKEDFTDSSPRTNSLSSGSSNNTPNSTPPSTPPSNKMNISKTGGKKKKTQKRGGDKLDAKFIQKMKGKPTGYMFTHKGQKYEVVANGHYRKVRHTGGGNNTKKRSPATYRRRSRSRKLTI